jgi:tRNA-dihydrouridine synthase
MSNTSTRRRHRWRTAAETAPLRALLRIGRLALHSRLVCAPLAEVTHSAFRRLIAELGGCDLQFTEMLSGRALLSEDLRTSPYVKRRSVERIVFYQLMLRPADPIERIVGRLTDVAPDGIDVNLACDAPAIRLLGAGSALFDDAVALPVVLRRVRRAWSGPLTVKIRLGHDAPDCEARLAERLRLIEDSGVDAITLHARFFEDKRKRPARHDRLAWATSRTPLPVIANGDIAETRLSGTRPEALAAAAGMMVGRPAIAQPWVFAAWERPVEIDPAAVWLRLHDYVAEDFAPHVGVKRMRLFTRYFARNFQFGHGLRVAVDRAPTMDAARVEARRFFETEPVRHAEASVRGL